MVIRIQYNNLYGWADCVDRFIWVVKQPDKIHIVPVGEIVELAHLVQENASSVTINSIWLVNNHVDLETYWTVH